MDQTSPAVDTSTVWLCPQAARAARKAGGAAPLTPPPVPVPAPAPVPVPAPAVAPDDGVGFDFGGGEEVPGVVLVFLGSAAVEEEEEVVRAVAARGFEKVPNTGRGRRTAGPSPSASFPTPSCGVVVFSTRHAGEVARRRRRGGEWG